jgi:hypothetical protein
MDVATVGFAVVLGEVVGEVPGPSSAVAVALALAPEPVLVSALPSLPPSSPTREGPQPANARQNTRSALLHRG